MGRRDMTGGVVFRGTLLVVGGRKVRKMLDGGDRVRCAVCVDGSFSLKFLGAALEADVTSTFVLNLGGWSK